MQGVSIEGKVSRFSPISELDEMLEPQQVCQLCGMINGIKTEILGIADPTDGMLPECSLFVPNLLAEFNENPKLAMIHGLGTKHAWIRISMLKEAMPVCKKPPLVNSVTAVEEKMNELKWSKGS